MNTVNYIILDSCAIAGELRRLALLGFARAGAYRPIWSAAILKETLHAIPKTLRNADMSDADAKTYAADIIQKLTEQFPDAMTGSVTHISTPALPDPDDQHVLALAMQIGARSIVTENLKDFPSKTLSRFRIRALNTDTFLAETATKQPDAARQALIDMVDNSPFPETDKASMLQRMKQSGLKKLARFYMESS